MTTMTIGNGPQAQGTARRAAASRLRTTTDGLGLTTHSGVGIVIKAKRQDEAEAGGRAQAADLYQ